MNRRDKILWVDDEIDLLRPYVIFLQEKNYDVTLSTNGQDAIEMCQKQHFDIIFLLHLIISNEIDLPYRLIKQLVYPDLSVHIHEYRSISISYLSMIQSFF